METDKHVAYRRHYLFSDEPSPQKAKSEIAGLVESAYLADALGLTQLVFHCLGALLIGGLLASSHRLQKPFCRGESVSVAGEMLPGER